MRTLLVITFAITLPVWSQNASGDLTRILAGVEETASSANPAAKFFFDFFISRPLGQASASTDPLGSAYRWWGDVRIASMPLQTAAPLSSLAANLAQQARSLTLNELAQTGEFQTGFEWQWPRGRGGPFHAPRPRMDRSRLYRRPRRRNAVKPAKRRTGLPPMAGRPPPYEPL